MDSMHILVLLATCCSIIKVTTASKYEVHGVAMGRNPHVDKEDPTNCNRMSLMLPTDQDTTEVMLTQMAEHSLETVPIVASIWKRGDVEALLRLDRMNIRGGHIWHLYDDLCSQSLDCLVDQIYSNSSGLVKYVNLYGSKQCAPARLLDEEKTCYPRTEVQIQSTVFGKSYDCYLAPDRHPETWHRWFFGCFFIVMFVFACVVSWRPPQPRIARVQERRRK